MGWKVILVSSPQRVEKAQKSLWSQGFSVGKTTRVQGTNMFKVFYRRKK